MVTRNILKLGLGAAVLALYLIFLANPGVSGKLPKDLLVFASTDSVTTWDPSAAYSTEATYMPSIYETLLWVSPPGSKEPFQPGLATSWEADETGKIWTFQIRQGVTFHDGGRLDATVVKRSLERTMDMGKGASFIFGPIESITVLDEYTVRFNLKEPAPLRRILASANAAWIMSPKAVDNDREWFDRGQEAGCGPYVLERWKPDEEIVFKKFDNYWKGWDGPHLERIVVKIVKEGTVAEQMLEAGAADIATRIPTESMRDFDDKDCCELLSGPSFKNYALHLNTAVFPFSDQRIRLAVSYALPYQDIIEVGVAGFGREAVGPVPYGQFGHNQDLHQYQQDLDKARALMQEAGYPDGLEEEVLFTYTSENQAEKNFAPLVKEALAKIGIQTSIRPMIWTAQWDLMKRGPEGAQDMSAVLWWPTYSDPYETLYSLWHIEDEPYWNFSYYKNPEFDQLIKKAYFAVSQGESKALYSEAQSLLIEDAPSVFLFDVTEAVFKRNEVKGYTINPNYPRVPFFYDMYKE